MAQSSAFIPIGNAVAIATSTTSASIAMAVPNFPVLLVTNRSTGNGWINWGATAPTAAFPVTGNTTGASGIEVPPGAQLVVQVNGSAAFVAGVIDSGTGVMSFVPGDGL